MNTKRQTVWLVSMLSLMVVLSAYYLFTEDVQDLDLSSQTLAGTEIKVDAVTNGQSDAVKTDAAAKGLDQATSSDAAVLQKVQASAQAVSGKDYFTNMHMKRTEDLAKQVEKWMTISLDSKKSTQEVEAALAEVNKIQDLDDKTMNVEDILRKTYKNAIVLQEGGKWKVVVQTAKLERSEGVSIVDLVMKELGTTPDKITVQYMQ